MLADYLRSFWRGVLRNKVATLINVGGLALGLTVFFALSFYVDREFSWDSQWEGADRIYRAAGAQEGATGPAGAALLTQSPWVMGTYLQGANPDAFEVYARVYQTANAITFDRQDYPNFQRYLAEPSFLDLIQFDTVAGSLDKVFADPRSVAISEFLAKRIFGEASPLGKTLTLGASQNFFNSQPSGNPDYVIKAVFKLPQPTTLEGIALLGVLEPTALPQANVTLDQWMGQPIPPPQPGQPPPAQPAQPLQVTHYFRVREGVDVAAIGQGLRAFMDENGYMSFGTAKTRYVFQKLQDVHLMSSPFAPADNVQRLLIYAAIGVLVLAISGCNFVMLATLRLVDRLREVGVRKSLGGGAGQLMWQYLLDAFFHTLAAAALAVLFLVLAFPKLATMFELPIQLDLLTPRNLGLCLLMIVAFTLVSSAYPAWMTSHGKPGPLLRNGGAVVGTGTGLRKLLVGIQFAIVVVLLLATAVVRQQIDYTRGRDPGYNVDGVLAVNISSFDALPRTSAIVAEFRKLPSVAAASVGGMSPGVIMITPPTRLKATVDGEVREAGIQQLSTSAEYFKVMSIRILAGREFSDELDAPPTPAPGAPPQAPPLPGTPLPEGRIILNESAARLLGFTPEEAIEQLLDSESSAGPNGQTRTQPLRIIGVVADTQFSSALLPPEPQYYRYSATNTMLAVKPVPGADAAAVTEDMRAAWDSVVPGTTFVIQDFAARTAFQLRREEFEADIISGSTLLAIVIALLGLYGLVAATVLKRVKEIGVRKVMGAERSAIVTLFLVQFSKPIVVANVLAWPFGYWAIKQWLERFPYQLDTPVILLSSLGASLIALLIAWLTVGVMAARASSVKPVVALRYE